MSVSILTHINENDPCVVLIFAALTPLANPSRTWISVEPELPGWVL